MQLDENQKRFLVLAVGGVVAFLAVIILLRPKPSTSASTNAATDGGTPAYIPTTDYNISITSGTQESTPGASPAYPVRPIIRGPITMPPNYAATAFHGQPISAGPIARTGTGRGMPTDGNFAIAPFPWGY